MYNSLINKLIKIFLITILIIPIIISLANALSHLPDNLNRHIEWISIGIHIMALFTIINLIVKLKNNKAKFVYVTICFITLYLFAGSFLLYSKEQIIENKNSEIRHYIKLVNRFNLDFNVNRIICLDNFQYKAKKLLQDNTLYFLYDQKLKLKTENSFIVIYSVFKIFPFVTLIGME